MSLGTLLDSEYYLLPCTVLIFGLADGILYPDNHECIRKYNLQHVGAIKFRTPRDDGRAN